VKRFLFTVFLITGLLLSFYGYSQDTISKIEKPHSIFFAPLNLFDFVNPNFQIGYEQFVTRKLSLQIAGGLIINHSIENYIIDLSSGVKDCPYTNKGFRVSGSIKYNMLEKRVISMKDLYFSFIGFYFNLRRMSEYWNETLQNLPRRTLNLYVSPEIFYLRNKSGITRYFLISDPDFEYSFGIAPEPEDGYLNAYTSFITMKKK